MTTSISATDIRPTSISAMPLPAPKNAEYSTADVVLTFFKEKVKDVAKAGSYLAFWATQTIPDLPLGVAKFNNTMRDFKNFISVTEIPEKLSNLGASASSLVSRMFPLDQSALSASTEKVSSVARKVFKDTMSLINSTADTIDFAHLFVPISKEILRWVSGINFAATIGFAGNGAVEQIQKISGVSNIDPKCTKLYLLNLARDVSYVALGVMGFACFVTATPLVPWMVVACLTSGLTFSISSYFYEKIVDPENKGKNLNPTVVVENHISQRNYARRIA